MAPDRTNVLRERARVALLITFGLTAIVGPGSVASAASRDAPAVGLSITTARPGDVTVVVLEHWQAGVVTIEVCGNAARRGSRDCDLIGAQSVKIRPAEVTRHDFVLSAPPVGCPCVVRVADAANGMVSTTPIVLEGVPDAPELIDTGSLAPDLRAEVRLTDRAVPWPRSWLSAFGGPAPRTMVVTLTNHGEAEAAGLQLTVVVGRSSHDGAEVARRPIPAIQPGAVRRIHVPFELPAPAWGDYVVSGSVSGTTVSAPFSVDGTNDAWALVLLVPLGMLAIARVLRRRERRRAHAITAPATDVIPFPPLPECSPTVGAPSGERWRSPPYPAAVAESTSTPRERATVAG